MSTVVAFSLTGASTTEKYTTTGYQRRQTLHFQSRLAVFSLNYPAPVSHIQTHSPEAQLKARTHMPSRPDPPSDSQELTEYSVGDKVYYYRAGTALSTSKCRSQVSNPNPVGKWRCGEIQGRGGSSVDSPRYLVSLSLHSTGTDDHYLTCEFRSRTTRSKMNVS